MNVTGYPLRSGSLDMRRGGKPRSADIVRALTERGDEDELFAGGR
jgi:hypothetical protein